MKCEALALPIRLAPILAVAILSGCTVGPDFQAPIAPGISSYTRVPLAPIAANPSAPGGQAQSLAAGADVPARWWTLFHAPALDALEEQALKANPDLAAARASLLEAHELYLAQKGGLLPAIDISGQMLRQKDSAIVSPTLAQPVPEFSLYTGQVSVSYRLDLFGAVRRQVEQAGAQAERQRYQYEASYLSLTTNVAVAAIQSASLRDQIQAEEGLVGAARNLLEIERRQQDLGQIAGADVAAQALALAQAEAALPPLHKALAQQLDMIAALSGQFPSEATVMPLRLADLTLPVSLPVSLPSRLVNQRPDIRAAEAALHAATAAVGVAEADRLPDLELSASFGGASTILSNLLSHSDQAWSVAAGITEPLFHGGALLHKQKAAEAVLDQTRAQYRSTVIAAFQNVADILQAIEHDADALAADAAAVQAAHQALDIAQARARLGSVSGGSVLGIQQSYQTALAALVQAKAARFTDTVTLFQALGGGWWNRPS
jgi:NodT family efflux transporter outer membrane factor (OMF) lipoprotein